MMGTKTLAEIREELWQRLTDTGEDPIEWLDNRIAARKRKGQTTDVYEAIKHGFERVPAKTTGSQRGGRATNGKPKTAGKRPDVLAELEAVTRALERATAKKARPRKRKAKA